MRSESAGAIPSSESRRRDGRRELRALTVQLLGPLTIVAGVVWAVAQPYRIAFLHPDGKGVYEFIAQPPLLVVLVGLVFSFLIAPGLVADLEDEGDGSAR